MSQQGDPALLRTKLHQPPVAEDAVPRPQLLERLDQGRGHPLTLVSIPAGYGKSTLLSSWLAGVPCRTAWVSLDEGSRMAELLERLDVEGDDGDFARDVLAVCARAKGTRSISTSPRRR